MKRTLATVALVSVLGATAACTGESTPDGADEETPSSESSQAPGMDSHSFEGEGDDDYVTTDPVELYGQYEVKWEVSGNEVESSGDPGNFEANLEGSDNVSIDSTNVADGSGTKNIQLDHGEYHASVFSGPDSQWTLTLTRTCAGLPPDCPPLQE